MRQSTAEETGCTEPDGSRISTDQDKFHGVAQLKNTKACEKFKDPFTTRSRKRFTEFHLENRLYSDTYTKDQGSKNKNFQNFVTNLKSDD